MKLYEYQAKRLFSEYSIPVPGGRVAFSAVEAEGAIESLGLPVVVKAQVLAGGRGKAGGIRLARSRDEALEAVQALLGKEFKGTKINRLLIEKAVDFRRELYCSISVDRASKSLVAMLSPVGGVEIEGAAADPGKVLRQTLDIAVGVTGGQLSRGASFLRMEGDLQEKELSDILSNLFRLFIEKDCSLAEINPLFVDEESLLVAGDAKVVIDDNAIFRHGEFSPLADQEAVDPLETEARKKKLSYVRMGGTIGCIVNGAGLAMGYYFSENPESERIGKSEDDPTSKGIDSKLVVGLGAVAYAAFGNAGAAGRYLETVGHAALALAGADAGVEMSKDSDG